MFTPGTKVAHYRIEKKIGAGGMGDVYLAEDTKLQRQVALKFLPSEYSSEPELKTRFTREAQAAASLNHPNIVTVFEISEHEGRLFIAMEYVEGESLKDLIARKELSIGEVLDVALQISDGMTVAHQAGIVHRDIKPQNILMGKDARVRICDFGLAKAKRDVTLTQAGSTLGTIAYMSPEQAQGKEVDQRSDIFSFGTLLYEMVTRQMPFRGEHEAAMIHAIVNDTPEPMARYKTDVPASLQRIVDKSLKKDVATRYQSAAELVADLKDLQQELRTTTPIRVPRRKTLNPVMLAGIGALVLIAVYALISLLSPPGERRSIGERKMLAVLPFENLGSAEDEYFADGMTEELMARLASIEGLGVIARTSAMQYKNTDKSIKRIGEELGVEYILEGTVRWQRAAEGPSRVRVTPQLIRVSDATHLWADVYEKDMADIFQVQSDIAEQVVEALGITLLERERRVLESKPTDNLEAYDYYLRGNDYLFYRGYADARIAAQMYEKAVELDSTFALAYAQLSRAQTDLYWFYYDRTTECLARAKIAVDKALQLDPDLPEAHLALGWYHYHGYLDYEQALEQFAIVQKQQPDNTDLSLGIAAVQRRQGKFEEAIINFKKASELDPRSSQLAFNAGETYALLRNYTQAEPYFDHAISLTPDWPRPHVYKALLYLRRNGDTEKARAILKKASHSIGSADHPLIVLNLVLLDVFDRKYQEALDRLSSASSEAFETQFYYIPKAQLYAGIYGLMSRPQLEQANYDSARSILEIKIKQRPEDAGFHSSLGIAYAGLGRKQEAIREAEKAVELLPVSKEAYRGYFRVKDLAHVYVMVGEYDAAIDRLELLLSFPGWMSIPLLRLDPIWDPLRDHPRFQKLLEGGT
jgi:serine/threonine protein kinase/tetratricopeptide (TPR) repeat protein